MAHIICAPFQRRQVRQISAMQKLNGSHIRKLALLQFAFSFSISLCALVISQAMAVSLLAGGLIASFANGYFAWKVDAKPQETEPAQILSTYYRAEVGKIILTVMLFVFVINVIKPLNVIALMGAYLLITMIPWLASFFVNDDDENWREKNVR